MGCRENLANVPGAVDRGDGAGARLRSDEWSVGERDDVFAGGGAVADEALGDQDAVVLADTEDALVESLWCSEHRHSPLSTSSGLFPADSTVSQPAVRRRSPLTALVPRVRSPQKGL